MQGLRASTLERNDLAMAISNFGDELAGRATAQQPPTFSVAVEGETRDLHPIVRDEIYKIAAEALRNAFRHADAERVEVEIHYDDEQFRLRVRDDGKGIDAKVLANQGLDGHYGLRGMPERAGVIGGKLAVWSEVGEWHGDRIAASGQHRLRDNAEALMVVTRVDPQDAGKLRTRRRLVCASRSSASERSRSASRAFNSVSMPPR